MTARDKFLPLANLLAIGEAKVATGLSGAGVMGR
ncbi:hypothetical protein EV384_3063 [Micromonospora kangleipakensis]|uniref:Uncharacterized protein n=1 Tax=Micromonospora kangleipakensis TaxID=1077942 RepID=A0A4Q8BAL8_9ACTN|nr:hypothetical protein EV384_3063 [Micromonospora kangleipakensis]